VQTTNPDRMNSELNDKVLSLCSCQIEFGNHVVCSAQALSLTIVVCKPSAGLFRVRALFGNQAFAKCGRPFVKVSRHF